MKRDTAMTSPDVLAMVRELKVLEGGIIEKFWRSTDRTRFLMRVRTRQGVFHVIMQPGVRVNLTSSIEEDFVADGFAMNIRQHIAGRRITRVWQYEFDRVVCFDIENYTLVVELLSRGRLILVRDGKVLFASQYAKMRDRDIVPGVEFKFAPNPPKDPRYMSIEEFRQKLSSAPDVVRGLVKMGLGSKYSEEICWRAHVEKNTPVESLTDEQLKRLYEETCSLLDEIERGQLSPRVYYDDNGCFVFSPVPLRSLNLPYREFSTFSEAVDAFFVELRQRELIERLRREYEEKRKQLEKQLEQQRGALAEYTRKAELMEERAYLIYEHMRLLERLLSIIRSARERGFDWDEIRRRIKEAKETGVRGAELIETVTKDGKVVVKLDGVSIPFDVKRSLIEQASEFLEKAKKARQKARRVQEEIKKTEEEIKRIEEELQRALSEQRALVGLVIRRAPRQWYEAFHWFISSDGFLVVAGRDAQSNERLVKRYMEPSDLFLHVDIPGGAVVLIKNPRGERVPESTLREAALFAAVYSKAWKEQLPGVDVFWTTPDCVSKSPPPGHYLPTGSFIIREKKGTMHVTDLRLALGVEVRRVANVVEVRLVMGPPEVIARRTHLYVVLKPGKLQKSAVAKRVLELLRQKCRDRVELEVVKRLKAEHFIEHIPGPSEIVE